MYKHRPFKAKPFCPGGYTQFRPDHMVSEKWDPYNSRDFGKDVTFRRVQRKQQRRVNKYLCVDYCEE